MHHRKAAGRLGLKSLLGLLLFSGLTVHAQPVETDFSTAPTSADEALTEISAARVVRNSLSRESSSLSTSRTSRSGPYYRCWRMCMISAWWLATV